MKKILLSCIALAAGAAMTMAQDAPQYPDHLDFTLNGETEIPGVTVRQGMTGGPESLHIDIKGTCDADKITITFATPEGWDGLMIMDQWEEGEISTIETRSDEDWLSKEAYKDMQFHEGNSLTYALGDDFQNAEIALVWGDKVYKNTIELYFDVKNGGGTVDPGDTPVFPKELNITLSDDNLDLEQGFEWGMYNVTVTGETTDSKVIVTFDIPDGWDGFVGQIITNDPDAAEIVESTAPPKKTRAEEGLWVPLDEVLEMGFVKGNQFICKVGEMIDFEIYLYKGDMCYFDDYGEQTIAMSVDVTRGEVTIPEFPANFKVSTNVEGLTITQGEEYYAYYIKVEGECSEDSFDITVEVPEGWDGFIGMTDLDMEQGEIEPLKKAQTPELLPLDYMLMLGMYKTNTLTFKADGEDHQGTLYLYKDDLVDVANGIGIYVEVSKGEAIAPVYPDDLDITTTDGATVWEGATTELPEGTLSENEQTLVTEMFVIENSVLISGQIEEDNVNVEFNLPEGWNGVQPFKINIPDFGDYDDDYFYGTRANESDWQILDEIKMQLSYMMGYFDTTMEGGTEFEFKADEKQLYLCYLYTDLTEGGETFSVADTANPFLLVVDVKGKGSGVENVESVSSARYYNLQGAEIANPETGIYVKVTNGKASKVVVK